jgi:hypothetical protein
MLYTKVVYFDHLTNTVMQSPSGANIQSTNQIFSLFLQNPKINPATEHCSKPD